MWSDGGTLRRCGFPTIKTQWKEKCGCKTRWSYWDCCGSSYSRTWPTQLPSPPLLPEIALHGVSRVADGHSEVVEWQNDLATGLSPNRKNNEKTIPDAYFERGQATTRSHDIAATQRYDAVVRYAPLRNLVLSDMAFAAAVAATATDNASWRERSYRLQFGPTTLRRSNRPTTCGEAVAILARRQT